MYMYSALTGKQLLWAAGSRQLRVRPPNLDVDWCVNHNLRPSFIYIGRVVPLILVSIELHIKFLPAPQHNKSITIMVRSSSDAALTVADQVLSKQAEYTQSIEGGHVRVLDLASRLQDGGELAQILLDFADECDGEEQQEGKTRAKLQSFLTEQRTALKSLTGDNVRRTQDVDAFVKTVGKLRDDIRLNRTAASNATLENDNDDQANAQLSQQNIKGTGINYEQTITEAMNFSTRDTPASADVVDQHPYMRDLRERLGEKQPASSKTTGEDDDEFEVVNDQAGATTEQSLKCPITTMLFENPVKNNVCGHIFSRAGLDMLFRQHGRGGVKCPVPGCNNGHLKKADFVEDLETGLKVKRFKKRQERERNTRMSQMEGVDD